MAVWKLIKANIKSKKESFIGIAILVAIITCMLATIISVNRCLDNQYDNAIEGTNTGDIVYIYNSDDIDKEMLKEIASINEVEKIQQIPCISTRRVLTSQKEYRSMVFFFAYEPDKQMYQFFDDKGSNTVPGPGEIYLPKAMEKLLDCKIGDKIIVATGNGDESFTITRFFEEPFIGAELIGYKNVLINQDDFNRLRGNNQEACFNMESIHVFIKSEIKDQANYKAGKVLNKINKETGIQNGCVTSLVLSESKSVTLMMDNILSAIVSCFAILLLIVVLIVISHNVSSSIEMEYVSFGILKSQGFTNGLIRMSLVIQYILAGIAGSFIGLIGSIYVTDLIGNEFVSLTGLIWEGKLEIGLSMLAVSALFLFLALFTFLKTKKIARISPVQAISLGHEEVYFKGRIDLYVDKMKHIPLSMKLIIKSIVSNMKEYISTLFVIILLTTFTIMATSMNQLTKEENINSMVGTLDSNITIRITSDELRSLLEDIRKTIEGETRITKEYSTTNSYFMVDGTQLLGRVIDHTDGVLQPAIEGKNPEFDNEIAITEVVRDELGKDIGDTVIIDNNGVQKEYLIVGICKNMNDLGHNFTILLDGVHKMNPNFTIMDVSFGVEDDSKVAEIVTTLKEQLKEYDNDISIINDQQENDSSNETIRVSILGVTMVIYLISLLFIAIVIGMICKKAFLREKVDLGIYKAVGFTTGNLRLQFSFRFATVVLIGAILGTILNVLTNDMIMSKMLYSIGITNFHTNYTVWNILIPCLWICTCTFVYAWLSSRKIKRISCRMLIQE
jgi:putative ABC transport system permease protein